MAVGAHGRGALLVRDTPLHHIRIGENSDLLTMAQTSDTVFPAASDPIRDTSPDDEASDADDDGSCRVPLS